MMSTSGVGQNGPERGLRSNLSPVCGLTNLGFRRASAAGPQTPAPPQVSATQSLDVGENRKPGSKIKSEYVASSCAEGTDDLPHPSSATTPATTDFGRVLRPCLTPCAASELRASLSNRALPKAPDWAPRARGAPSAVARRTRRGPPP